MSATREYQVVEVTGAFNLVDDLNRLANQGFQVICSVNAAQNLLPLIIMEKLSSLAEDEFQAADESYGQPESFNAEMVRRIEFLEQQVGALTHGLTLDEPGAPASEDTGIRRRLEQLEQYVQSVPSGPMLKTPIRKPVRKGTRK
jgi:hypothetical protein